ncbi:MAG: hypothetical protein ABR564_00525 [Candidatus Dormibacteria bacterium]
MRCSFPEVAAARGQGLRRDHGPDRGATAFWDVHAELNTDHAAWDPRLLTRSALIRPPVAGAATRAADAWWAFLDEREAARSFV